MHWRSRLPLIPLCLCILFALTGCSLPQISAESRLFPAITIDFLDTYTLPVEGVDGWTAIAYDNSGTQATDPITYRFYTIAKGKDNTPQLQTLTLSLDTTDPTQPRFNHVAVTATMPLLNEAGELLTGDRFAPSGMALSPGKTLFLSSLGTNSQKIAPAIAEFDLATGQRQRQFPIPERYLPPTDEQAIAKGTEDGLGFAALAIDAGVASAVEPWRLFSAVAVPLQQDRPDAPDAESRVRLLHYLITDNKPRVLAEHAYSLLAGVDPSELVDLVVLPGNHFLSLERNTLYQMETVTASDTFLVPSLKSGLNGIGLRPVAKRSLLDLNALDLSLPHLEGMTLGSRLPDGSLSLLLVGDRTSENTSEVQLLLFRLRI